MDEQKKKRRDIDVLILTGKGSVFNVRSMAFTAFGEYNYIVKHELDVFIDEIDTRLKSKKFVPVIIDCDNLVYPDEVKAIQTKINKNFKPIANPNKYSSIEDNYANWGKIIKELNDYYGNKLVFVFCSMKDTEELKKRLDIVSTGLYVNNVGLIKEPAFVRDYNAVVNYVITKRNKDKKLLYKSNIAKYSLYLKNKKVG